MIIFDLAWNLSEEYNNKRIIDNICSSKLFDVFILIKSDIFIIIMADYFEWLRQKYNKLITYGKVKTICQA